LERYEVDFVERFKDRVRTLKGFLEVANFKGCANLSTDLLRASEFAKYPEGVFVGEFFESLLSNVRTLVSRFEVDKKDIEKIQKATIPVVEYAQVNIPFNSKNKKADFFDLILNARCVVTEIQIAYYREKPIKRPPMPMAIPESIEIETDEEE
jgi:hypothetical protein